jgi:hypothetical protein
LADRRFDAYIKEDVPEIPAEGYRIRQFSICYFLVDDSIRISELKQVDMTHTHPYSKEIFKWRITKAL